MCAKAPMNEFESERHFYTLDMNKRIKDDAKDGHMSVN